MKTSPSRLTITFLLSLCVFSNLVFGQDKATDSLKNVWKRQANDTGRVNTCIRIVQALSNNFPQEALAYSDSGLAISGKINFEKGKGDLLNMGGNIFLSQGNLKEALAKYLEALDIRKKIDDRRGIAGTLNNIGRVHDQLNNFPLAMSYYRQALAMNMKTGYKKWMAINYINIGVLHGKQKNNDSAIFYQEKAYALAKEINDERNMAFCSANIGVAFIEKGEYKKAIRYLEEALVIRRKQNDKFNIASSLNNLGYAYSKTGETKKAEPYFKEAYQLSKETGSQEGIINALEYMAMNYEEENDYKNALVYFKQARDFKDSLSKLETSAKIAEMQSKYDVAELKSRSLHDHEEISKQKNYIFYSVIAVLVLVILASVFFYRGRIRNKANMQSEKYFEDLRIIEEIGKKITSSFSVEEINTTIYEEINKLMDGTGFGIGIISDDGDTLVFPGYREKGEKLQEAVYSLKDENRLAVHCVNNRREIFINDLYNEVNKYVNVVLNPLTGARCESIIYLPLINKNRVIGAITVQSFSRHAYTQYHLGLLRNIAGHAAIALDNATLYQSMEAQVRERTKEVIVRQEELEKNYSNTQLLSEMGQEITSTLKFETIFSRLYENVNQLMPAEVFGVRIYHPEKNSIEYKFEYENGVSYPPEWVPMEDEDNYSVWSIRNKKEIFINDNLAEYSKYVKQIRVVSGDLPHSLIFYPMMVGEKVVGVITVQSFQRQAYKPIHLSILKTLASYTAIALENANLYETLEEKVNERTQEVMNQKGIIELKNKDITDSIRYAQKIQSALLPGIDKIGSKVKNFFVLFQPRDIVSGDFYFFTSSGPYNIFAVGDCTGHGVPGAIISAICINLTSEVLLDKEIYSSGEALEQIDRKLRTLLKQDQSGQSNDGMDCALCVVNTETNVLQFSGASRPLLLARKNELIEFKASKYSIGGHDEITKTFETLEYQLEKGDRLYLFSDGYADQFGGPKGKKFKYKKMQEMIQAHSSASMDEQRDIFHGELLNWKGKFEQVDDILMFGVEI